MSEQPGRYQRSFSGMIGAMVVLLVVVIAFVLFRDLNRNEPESPVEPVDYRQPASYAREAADFPLLAPRRLPEGWVATSVRFTGGRQQAWHLGVLTDKERYVGLEQSPKPAEEMVEEHVDPDAQEGPTVRVDGQTWQTWTDEGGDRALVREDESVTTLVVGRVDQDTLEELLATLR